MRKLAWLLPLSGAVAVAVQAHLAIRDGQVGAVRLAALGLGLALTAWALRLRRPANAGLLPRIAFSVAASGLLWISVLELALTRTTVLALGFLGLLALAVLGAVLLFALTRPMSGNTPGARAVLRIGMFASVLVISVWGMEAALRGLFPLKMYEIIPDDPAAGSCLVRSEDGHYSGRPGFRGRYVHPEFYGSRVEINDWGLRDGLDEASPPAEGGASVLVLGDSFAFGTGVSLAETYQEQLEARSAEITPRLRVYGAGMTGYGPLDELRMLNQLGDRVRPDVVIVSLFEGNDFQDNWTPDPESAPRPSAAGHSAAASRLGSFLQVVRTYRFWLMSSAIVQRSHGWLEPTLVFFHVIDPVTPRYGFVDLALRRETPQIVEAARGAMIENLQSIRERCGALGARLVILIIPDVLQVDPGRYQDFLLQQPPETRTEFDRTSFHRGFVGQLSELGFRVVDMLDTLESAAAAGRSGYLHEGHWNAHGHALAADRLVPVLKSLLAP